MVPTRFSFCAAARASLHVPAPAPQLARKFACARRDCARPSAFTQHMRPCTRSLCTLPSGECAAWPHRALCPDMGVCARLRDVSKCARTRRPMPCVFTRMHHAISAAVRVCSGVHICARARHTHICVLYQTTAMVSMVISRSQVLEKEVFLFQRIDAQGRGQMLHLKAIVFLRPTRDNIELLAKELMAPMFGEYHLFFSNVLSNDAVRTLAQADTYELVQQVREMFADFYALSPSSFSLSLPANVGFTTPLADRARDGLFALLLALKKKPVIRYLNRESLNPRTETRDPRPETRNPKS